MSGFVVDVAAVQYAADATTTVGDELGAVLARLRSDVEDVVSSRWRGNAANAFAIAWQEWDRTARDVVAELARVGDELTRTRVDYLIRDAISADELRAGS